MAQFFKKIVSKVGEFFRQKPEKPARLADLQVPAHRGAALGSSVPEEMDISEANQREWLHLSSEAVYHFLHDEAILYVHSTNVLWAKYQKDQQWLTLAYKDKRGRPKGIYRYSPISGDEAQEFLTYLSKGIFVWDKLRVRGTKTGHQKKAIKLA